MLRLKDHYFVVDKYYLIDNKLICRFTKVTPKGYNFIKIKNGKKFFKRNIYPRNSVDDRKKFTILEIIKVVEYNGIVENYSEEQKRMLGEIKTGVITITIPQGIGK